MLATQPCGGLITLTGLWSLSASRADPALCFGVCPPGPPVEFAAPLLLHHAALSYTQSAAPNAPVGSREIAHQRGGLLSTTAHPFHR